MKAVWHIQVKERLEVAETHANKDDSFSLHFVKPPPIKPFLFGKGSERVKDFCDGEIRMRWFQFFQQVMLDRIAERKEATAHFK